MVLRQLPTQARARQPVEHILATAGSLLAEVGTDGFNTNLLAERAGVTVPTVYRYFPNKIAVLEELARRLATAWDGWFDDELLADPSCDWRKVWCGYIDAFIAGIVAAPAGLAIRNALHSTPELRHIEERDTNRLIERLTRAIRRREPSLDAKEVRACAEVLLISAIAVVDQALTGSARARAARIEALKSMHVAFLESLLDSPSSKKEIHK
jgi:AcrR family transcriptional regulator